jgi:hypothetical protein
MTGPASQTDFIPRTREDNYKIKRRFETADAWVRGVQPNSLLAVFSRRAKLGHIGALRRS